jgi:hypothetical protein
MPFQSFQSLDEAKDEIKKLRELASTALGDSSKPKTEEKCKWWKQGNIFSIFIFMLTRVILNLN